jgi:hypothetical protein
MLHKKSLIYVTPHVEKAILTREGIRVKFLTFGNKSGLSSNGGQGVVTSSAYIDLMEIIRKS